MQTVADKEVIVKNLTCAGYSKCDAENLYDQYKERCKLSGLASYAELKAIMAEKDQTTPLRDI